MTMLDNAERLVARLVAEGKPGGIGDWELITAEIAKRYLSHSIGNRSERKAQEYARDMLEGRWRNNPQPLIFDENDAFRDGHNRLHALLLAAKTNPDIVIWFFVIRGAEASAVELIDVGAKRTNVDALVMSGLQEDDVAKNRFSGVLRYIGEGVDYDKNVPRSLLVPLWEQNLPFIRAAVSDLPPSYYSPVQLIAALAAAARAGVTDEQLKRFKTPFVQQMESLDSSDHDVQPAFKLKSAWDNGHKALKGTNHSARKACYLICISAIQLFLDQKEMKSFKAAKDDIIRLPNN